MTICIQEGTYFYGIWIIDTPEVNYMACLSKPKDGDWEFQYRFRYTVDDKVFDSEDIKNWYSFRVNKSESIDALLPGILNILRTIANKMGATLDFIELKMDGGNKEIMDRIKTHKSMNSKQVTSQ